MRRSDPACDHGRHRARGADARRSTWTRSAGERPRDRLGRGPRPSRPIHDPASSGTPLPAGPPYSSPSAPAGGGSAGQPSAPGPAARAAARRPPPPRLRRAGVGRAGTRHTGRTIGRTLAAALLVFVTVLLVLFVMFNTQTVDISLVFTDIEAPLVLALLVAAVLGGARRLAGRPAPARPPRR